MKRFIALLLFAAALLTLLACNPTQPEQPDGTSGDVETTPPPAEDVSVKLNETGKKYVIICSENSSKEVKDIASDLWKHFFDLKMGEIKSDIDWVQKAEQADNDNYEILIGLTNRPESAVAADALRTYLDYHIAVIENKICIYANTPDRLKEAVAYFKSKVALENGIFCYSGPNVYTDFKDGYAVPNMSICGTPIGEYTVVIPAAATDAERAFAEEYVKYIGINSGAVVDITDDSAAAVPNEILIGKTNRPESQTELSNGARILTVNKKLVVAVESDYYIGVIEGYFYKLLSDGAGIIAEGVDIAPDGSELKLDSSKLKYTAIVGGNGTTVASNIASEISRYNTTEGKNVAVPTKFSESTQSVYTCETKEIYDRYVKDIESAGNTILATNVIGSVYFTTFKTLGNKLVTAYYIQNEKIIRVIDEPYLGFDTELPAPADMALPEDTSTKIIMIPIARDYEQGGFVIRLSDGRFVLYDTGADYTAEDTESLVETLKEYSYHYKQGGKVQIAAIYISHLHIDHYGGLVTLANKYSNILSVDRVYANFPSTQKENYWDNPLYVESEARKVIDSAEKLGAKFMYVRSGQKVKIADATFEVMWTPDDLGQYELRLNSDGSKDTARDINNTCLYLRMTTKGGKVIIFNGDSRQGQSKLVYNMYKDGLKCDIMTVAHHGYNGSNTATLYTSYACPEILFWTNTKAKLDANTAQRDFIDRVESLQSVKKHIYGETTKRQVLEVQ